MRDSAPDGRRQAEGHHEGGGHYGRFAAMMLVSFAAMFALMYAMVDTFSDATPNSNQIYMAGLMVAAMAIIELALMGGMYPDKRVNLVIVAVSALALAGFWFAIRKQTAIGDRQFLKSMIPHHSGAILMCDEAPIRDDEIRQLCDSIVRSQRSEIDQMKRILARLERH